MNHMSKPNITKQPSDASDEQYLIANNLTLAYDEFGEQGDPALLLVMGLGTQMIAWPDAFCQGLAERGHRVIRFDNRDTGLSEKIKIDKPVSFPKLMLRQRLGLPLDVPYTLHDMATDTIGVLDALNIESAHMVGASMGAMIAQIVAAEFPDRCRSLTSIMSTTGNPALKKTSWRATKQLLSRPKVSDEAIILEHSMKTWGIIGSPDFMPSEDELRARILRSLRRSMYPVGYRHQMAAIAESGDRRALLKKISTPTLVIHGKADVLVPMDGGVDTANNIDGAKLKLIEGMGHDLPKELIPRFVRMISEHTASV